MKCFQSYIDFKLQPSVAPRQGRRTWTDPIWCFFSPLCQSVELLGHETETAMWCDCNKKMFASDATCHKAGLNRCVAQWGTFSSIIHAWSAIAWVQMMLHGGEHTGRPRFGLSKSVSKIRWDWGSQPANTVYRCKQQKRHVRGSGEIGKVVCVERTPRHTRTHPVLLCKLHEGCMLWQMSTWTDIHHLLDLYGKSQCPFVEWADLHRYDCNCVTFHMKCNDFIYRRRT